MWACQGGSYEFQLKSCKELLKCGQVPRAEGDSRGTQPVDPAPAAPAPGSTRGPCRAVPAPLTDAALPFRSTGRLQPRGGGLSRGYPVALRARPWRRRTERRGWPPPACAPR